MDGTTMSSTRPRIVIVALVLLAACKGAMPDDNSDTASVSERPSTIEQRLARYTTVELSYDTSSLTAKERRMLPLLIDAARTMDAIYWRQAYGDRDSLLKSIPDADTLRLVEINYGPWDRLADNEPFIAGVGPKPPGANFYPHDITKEAFDAAAAASKAHGDSLRSLYTVVKRDKSGALVAIPYHVAFPDETKIAADKLREAAKLAEDPGLRRYLEARAKALLSDDYRASDIAWLDMKDNTVDVVIGPIETYEDQLFGYKSAHEAYVLIKDKEWSERLSKYAAFLPALQKGLPVPDEYKQEKPGTDSDLNAYNAVYYAGQANAGAKTIAINLPNDEQVQLQKGTRRLQLENVMRAKFDKILVPIAEVLVDSAQLRQIDFNAFFENTMFHEVAHGLGIKNTINGKGTVRTALKERASALEEEKADILGLHMVQALSEGGNLDDEDVSHNYVTFLASLFRSVRFGAADAHGRANIASFNYLAQSGAFTRDDATGRYSVDPEKFKAGIESLAEKILRLQGDGDYDGVGKFYDDYGRISPTLSQDLAKLRTKGIPVDVVFGER
jgi:hypothetical protein